MPGDQIGQQTKAEIVLIGLLRADDQRRVAITPGAVIDAVRSLDRAGRGQHFAPDPAADRRGRRGLAEQTESPGGAVEMKAILWIPEVPISPLPGQQPGAGPIAHSAQLLDRGRLVGDGLGDHRVPPIASSIMVKIEWRG